MMMVMVILKCFNTKEYIYLLSQEHLFDLILIVYVVVLTVHTN